MSQNVQAVKQEEWLKILGKGMVTLPKKWRDELGISSGDIVKARREGRKVVIEMLEVNQVPYRVYNREEIAEFVESDTLNKDLVARAQRDISK